MTTECMSTCKIMAGDVSSTGTVVKAGDSGRNQVVGDNWVREG